MDCYINYGQVKLVCIKFIQRVWMSYSKLIPSLYLVCASFYPLIIVLFRICSIFVSIPGVCPPVQEDNPRASDKMGY